MAQVPTPNEAALKILSQFKAANIRTGEILMRGAVEIKALQDGLRSSDVESGLKYAVENGWIDISDAKFVRLTEVGFGKM